MPIKIEKKYRLSREQLEPLRRRLAECNAEPAGAEEFKENVIYTGTGLDPTPKVLRLRRKGTRALFTYKERDRSGSAVKRQREEETEVADADALAAILEALGYRPALVYEKRRATWRLRAPKSSLTNCPSASSQR